MTYISIDINKNCADAKNFITSELNNFKFDYQENSSELNYSGTLRCSLLDEYENTAAKNPENYLILAKKLSLTLAHYIVKNYDLKLVKKMIAINYCYFDQLERKRILVITMKNLEAENSSNIDTMQEIRLNIVSNRIFEYFSTSNHIILDGFVNFRLKDYMNCLDNILEKSINEFLAEKEYKEFINLLRYFVDSQKPKYDTINVILKYDNEYTLLDSSNEEISNIDLEDFSEDLPNDELNTGDLLVSSLISLAPKKIIIHNLENYENKELIETIRNIFFKKVTLCTDCNICALNLVTH